MDIREQLHRLIDKLADDQPKADFHAAVDDLEEANLAAAVAYMLATLRIYGDDLER
jgi:hypothetical protein